MTKYQKVAAGGDVSYMDFLNFKIENHIDAHPRSKYYLLLICVGFIVFIFAFMWSRGLAPRLALQIIRSAEVGRSSCKFLEGAYA